MRQHARQWVGQRPRLRAAAAPECQGGGGGRDERRDDGGPPGQPVVASSDGGWASLKVRAAVAEASGDDRTPRVWDESELRAWVGAGPPALRLRTAGAYAARAGVACVHLEALARLLDIRGTLNVADLRGRAVAFLDCHVRVAPRGAPGGLAARLGDRVALAVSLKLRGLALDADDAPALAYRLFDRPLTVALADPANGGGDAQIDHEASFDLLVTPDLLRYVATEALLVEARLLPREAAS